MNRSSDGVTAPSAPVLQIGETVDHFIVTDFVGAGGMAEVGKARDFSLDRLVALNVLPPTVTPPERRRFLREARPPLPSSIRMSHRSLKSQLSGTIRAGESVLLQWNSFNATHVVITPDVGRGSFGRAIARVTSGTHDVYNHDRKRFEQEQRAGHCQRDPE